MLSQCHNVILRYKPALATIQCRPILRSCNAPRRRLRHRVVRYRLIESGHCTFPSKPTSALVVEEQWNFFTQLTSRIDHTLFLTPARSLALFPSRGISNGAWKSRLFSRGVRRPRAKRGRRKSATKISAMTRYSSGLRRPSWTEKAIRAESTVYCDSFDIFLTNLCLSTHTSPIATQQWRDRVRFPESFGYWPYRISPCHFDRLGFRYKLIDFG